MASFNVIREKSHKLTGYTLTEIAEIILDLEADKGGLEVRIEELTRERDELAAQVEA